MRHVHVISQFRGSINEITEDLITGLNDDFIITREGIEEPMVYDILICHFINPNISRHPNFDKFKHKILIQPIDGTVIKKDIINEFNKFDVLVTPANAGKEILIKNGVTKPIEVIPNFYKKEDLGRINFEIPKKIKKHIKDKYIFYHESTCHPRKGVDIMLRAYVKAFSSNIKKPDVILIIKTPNHNPTTFDYLEKLKKDISLLQKQYKYPAKIIKISQWLDKEKMVNLMSLCDCYIQPSKIEGFGIPVLRAVLSKKIIIATDYKYNGYIDFVSNDSNDILVPGKVKIAEGEINPMYTEISEWCEISEEQLSKAMLSASSKRKIGFDINVLTNYYYDKIIKKYKELLLNPLFNENLKFVESNIIIK